MAPYISTRKIFFGILACMSLWHCLNKPEPFISDQALRKHIAEQSITGDLTEFMLPMDSQYHLIPQDTSNPITPVKVALGQQLFFDPAISFDPKCKAAAQTFSCATCHFAEAGFQAGIAQAIAGGGRGFGRLRHKHPSCQPTDLDVQQIRTPSILNCAYQEVQLWSGKLGCCGPNLGTDSLWPKGSFVELNRLGMSGVETQARVALEAHGMRMSPGLVVGTPYKQYFDSAYGDVRPDLRYRRFIMAKAIAAFERTVITNQAPFQLWLRGDSTALDQLARKGAHVFFGKGKCVKCHRGPALNSMAFYALGMKDLEGPDIIVKDSSDEVRLGRGGFTKKQADMYCFKVPQLYNLKQVEFLGHGSSFCSVEEVIRYKNKAKPENPKVPSANLSPLFVPLHLSEREIKALSYFINESLYDAHLSRYTPPSVFSGLCFPNNDRLSRQQLGCQEH